MKITFELSDKDLRYFRQVLQKVRKGQSAGNEDVILREAQALLTEVGETDAPEFVRNRISQLGKFIAMLEDKDWRLEGSDRKRVRNALAYFADPDDLIPDRVPGLGYLDDAIMVELVARELTHEIAAYEDFCEYRERRLKTDEPPRLEARRKALQARMRRRSRKERSRQYPRGSSSSRIRLW